MPADSGSALLEVVFGITIFLPISMFAVDCIFVGIAAYENICVCNKASRAASKGMPDFLEKGAPLARARRTVESQNRNLFLSTAPDVTVVEITDANPDIDVFGGLVHGQVTVQTRAKIKPPFLLLSGLRREYISLTASQTYPITFKASSSSQRRVDLMMVSRSENKKLAGF